MHRGAGQGAICRAFCGIFQSTLFHHKFLGTVRRVAHIPFIITIIIHFNVNYSFGRPG